MSDPKRDDPEQALIAAIDAGRCVAFVGAGLSFPAVGGWRDLLLEVAKQSRDPSIAAVVAELIDEGTDNVSLEAAAQLLEDAEPDGKLGELVATTIEALCDRAGAKQDVVRQRVEYLRRIPLSAIVTTNFDRYLPGELPGPAVYRRILRAHEQGTPRYGSPSQHAQCPVVCLHGSLAAPRSITMTRRAYRKRLHADPGYRRFLGTLFSTHTVIFIGFSFTDAYVNELRSEVLTLFGHDDEASSVVPLPTAFTVLPNVTDARRRFLERHEGLRVVSYDTPEGDHGAFDRLLARLAKHTSPLARLARAAQGRRILWLDPAPENNRYVTEEVRGIDLVSTVDQALVRLATCGYDLVITHLGHGASPPHASTAEALLEQMQRPRHGAPVVVFGSHATEHADANKRRSLRAGASAYTYSWDALFREIERILSPGSVSA